MLLIKVILLFIIPANAVLLVLLRFNQYAKKPVLLVASYGLGPLLSGLLFYGLVYFLPHRENMFYVLAIFAVWLFVFVRFFGRLPTLRSLYAHSLVTLKSLFNVKVCIVVTIFGVILFVYLFQVFEFPIVEGDSAFYINQGKGYFVSKDTNWENKVVSISSMEEYIYNPMIAPGIPSFLALSSSLDDNPDDYLIYSFFHAYYYFLLLAILNLFIYEIASILKKPVLPSLFFGGLFFIFSWIFSRMLILGAKESVVYFLALLSAYFAIQLANNPRRNIYMETLLGIALGLNAFVNVHGVIILLIILLILLLISKQNLFDRFKQLLFVFIVQLFFGAFEFISNFNGIFFLVFRAIADKLSLNIDRFFLYSVVPVDDEMKKVISLGVADLNVNSSMYRFNTLRDVYIRGKMQILTNVGVFGFYFWFFIGVFCKKVRELFYHIETRFILSFMLAYILVVIDPFNLNNNPNTLVLSGSTKYAGLVLLFSLTITSAYIHPMIEGIYNFLNQKYMTAIPLLMTIILSCLFFRDLIVFFGFRLLKSIAPFYKNDSFYQSKIESLFLLLFVFLVINLMILFLGRIGYSAVSKNIFVLNLIYFFVVTPYFITDFGKVPISKTFSFIESGDEDRMKNISNTSDLYGVFYFAKTNLPYGSLMSTNYNELYLYNDYFRFIKKVPTVPFYSIKNKCDPSNHESELYSQGTIYLCLNRI